MSAPPSASEAAITPGDDTRAIQEAAACRGILGANGTWVLILDIVLVAIFTYLNPVFFSLRNLQNLLLNGSEGLLLALAVTMLLGAGLFDLSIGANLVLSSIVGVSVLITVAGGTPGFLGAVGTQQFSNGGAGSSRGPDRLRCHRRPHRSLQRVPRRVSEDQFAHRDTRHAQYRDRGLPAGHGWSRLRWPPARASGELRLRQSVRAHPVTGHRRIRGDGQRHGRSSADPRGSAPTRSRSAHRVLPRNGVASVSNGTW